MLTLRSDRWSCTNSEPCMSFFINICEYSPSPILTNHDVTTSADHCSTGRSANRKGRHQETENSHKSYVQIVMRALTQLLH